MSWFKKRTTDPAEMDRLRSEIAAMGARLEATVATEHALDDRVRHLTTRLDTPMSPPPSEPPPGPPPGPPPAPAPVIDPAELADVRHQVQRIVDRVDELDARITSISVELANQISELSGDVESLGGAAPPTDEVLDELRDAQTRLAGEQARYQIAFRQDLAALADRLRRA